MIRRHGSQTTLRYMKKTMNLFHSYLKKKITISQSRPHNSLAKSQVTITLYTKIAIIGQIAGVFTKNQASTVF